MARSIEQLDFSGHFRKIYCFCCLTCQLQLNVRIHCESSGVDIYWAEMQNYRQRIARKKREEKYQRNEEKLNLNLITVFWLNEK